MSEPNIEQLPPNEQIPICVTNLNPFYQKTFEFIRDNQVSETGSLVYTTLILKLSLSKIQTPYSTEPRDSKTNEVYGIINTVTHHNVVILAPSTSPGLYDEYTIEFGRIIEVVSPVVNMNFQAYLQVINSLPLIVRDQSSPLVDMLEELKNNLQKYGDYRDYAMKLIFDGVNSRTIRFYDVLVKRNFIIVENYFIFPITVIGGFINVPLCENHEALAPKGVPYV